MKMKTETKRMIAYVSLALTGLITTMSGFDINCTLRDTLGKIPSFLVGIAGIGVLYTIYLIWDEAI
jgi:hypothetical protein